MQAEDKQIPTDAKDTSIIKPHILEFPMSTIFEMNQLQQKLMADGKQIYKFGFGQSPFGPPKCMIDELQAHAHEKDYVHVQGLLPLRQEIARFYEKYTKYPISAENVVVGPGSIENLFVFQQVFNGNLITPNPTWVSYGPQAKLAGNKHYWIEAYKDGEFEFNCQQFDETLTKLAGEKNYLFLTYPNNPMGITIGREKLKEIAGIARRHGCYIISDEIYSEQSFIEEGHTSIAEFYPERTIVSNGISKWLGAGGWRIGFMIIPDGMRPVIDAMNMYNSEMCSGCAAPIQWGTKKGFEDTQEMRDYFANTVKILKTLSTMFRRTLDEAGIQCTKTGELGSYYTLLDFTNQPKTAALQAKFDKLQDKKITFGRMVQDMMIQEDGIAMLQASAFGLPTEKLFFRLSFADFNGDAMLAKVAAGEEITEEFCRENCVKMFEGLQVLINWWTVKEVVA